jgi:hypothetical protein
VRQVRKGIATDQVHDLAEFVRLILGRRGSGVAIFRGQRTDEPLVPRLGRREHRQGLPDSERKIFNEFVRQVRSSGKVNKSFPGFPEFRGHIT